MTDTEQNIRIIKKYPNRRVYDTHESKYIKVDDLRQMIIDDIDFQVIDTQSKEDVTRSVILQQNQFFSDYLSQSLNFFNQQQEQFSNNIKDFISANPVDTFSEMSKKNMDMWRNMQESFFDQFTPKK